MRNSSPKSDNSEVESKWVVNPDGVELINRVNLVLVRLARIQAYRQLERTIRLAKASVPNGQ